MEMKAKSSLIRKHRKTKMWSQEQLAEACGLSLRTIQRVESRGSASTETIKALAAVFEVDSSSLFWPDGDFQVYKHRQWGFASIVTMLIVMVGVAVLSEYVALPVFGLGVLFAVLSLTALVFSSMTIEVNESEINWFFGLGFFRKTLPLEDVLNCQKVKNPLWMGLGIHAFGTGSIYNVSGLLGVEIELKGGSFIRLGTDEPNFLVQAINDAKDNLSAS